MEKRTLRSNSSIRMGEMSVASGDGELRTLLGSCIGLALHDRRRKIGGLAHIVLPSSRESTSRPGKFADTAIPALIEQMKEVAGGELNLIAKMAGGASMFSSTAAGNIGAQNSQVCEDLLRALRIPVIGKDCGGTQGRRMAFDTATGRVVIEMVGRDPIEL